MKIGIVGKSRYIDADKLCKDLTEMAKYQEPYKQSTILGVVSTIENTRTADVVKVVRCKYCKYCEEAHYEEEGEKPYIKLKCRWSNYSHQPNDYCSYGERKEK